MRRNYSNPILRVLEYPTYKNAVNAKCAECMGCDQDYLEPDFRRSIRDCSSHRCPLHSFRPYVKKRLK